MTILLHLTETMQHCILLAVCIFHSMDLNLFDLRKVNHGQRQRGKGLRLFQFQKGFEELVAKSGRMTSYVESPGLTKFRSPF